MVDDSIRAALVDLICRRESGHLGASNGILEILSALVSPSSPWEFFSDRDMLVLSKGHGAPALYLVLAGLGLVEDLNPTTFRRAGTPFDGHPRRGRLPGVEVSSGSLGCGISFGLGRAIASPSSQVVTLVSDGELQSGIALESLRQAGVLRLPNFHVLVDANGYQTSGPTREVGGSADALGPWLDQALDVAVVDGHDELVLGHRYRHVASGGCSSLTICRTQRYFGLPIEFDDEIYGEKIPEQLRVSLLTFARRATRK